MGDICERCAHYWDDTPEDDKACKICWVKSSGTNKYQKFNSIENKESVSK